MYRAAVMAGRRETADVAGKVVVVTGAGSGIGRATALLFGGLGASVHAVDVDEGRVEATRRELEGRGGRAAAHVVDCSEPAAVEALAEEVFRRERAVDVLHNNAGIGHAGRVEDTTLEDWQRVIAVNLMGVVHGVHSFVPRMLRQGRRAHVVNTASLAGLVPTAELVPYSTSKAGVVGLSEALDAELAPRGIRVTALCPGIIDTGIVAAATMRGDMADRHERLTDFYRSRGASAEGVAEAALDAVRRHRVIQPAPRWQVVPPWLLKRLAPRASQVVARTLPRVLGR